MLWDLVYRTLRPKGHETPNECLNRLTNERLDCKYNVIISEKTAIVEELIWDLTGLESLDRKHARFHDFDDFRPLVAVEVDSRYILVDGNHRVNRALNYKQDRQFQILLIRLK